MEVVKKFDDLLMELVNRRRVRVEALEFVQKSTNGAATIDDRILALGELV